MAITFISIACFAAFSLLSDTITTRGAANLTEKHPAPGQAGKTEPKGETTRTPVVETSKLT